MNNGRPLRRRAWLQTTGRLALSGLAGAALLPTGARLRASDRIRNPSANSRAKKHAMGTTLRNGKPAEVGMSAERLDRIAARLQEETAERGLTSASVLVARRGSIVLHRGFGKLGPQPDAPDTQPDTVYLLASISKPMTVCGLMLLVEQGEVVLGDPVQRYLPDFRGTHKDQVKVWHLLSHVSGMPDMLPQNIALRRAQAPLSKFVEGALRTPLRYEPGTRFDYQSMGTLLAAALVERVTGKRFRDYLREEVFAPLGMKRSVLGLDGLKIRETAWVQESNGDSEDARRWGANSPYWRDQGHPWGGVHSTTQEIAVLLQTFLNGGSYGETRLLSPTTTAAMTRDHNRTVPGAPWGLGWALRDSRVWNYFGDLGSAGTFGHVGSTGTTAWADPSRELICVLLTTRSAGYRRGQLLNAISNMAQAALVEA